MGVKQELLRRGVNTNGINRRALRHIEETAAGMASGSIPLRGSRYGLLNFNGSTDLERLHNVLLMVIEHKIHKGGLKLKPGADVTVCGSKDCKLNCSQYHADYVPWPKAGIPWEQPPTRSTSTL